MKLATNLFKKNKIWETLDKYSRKEELQVGKWKYETYFAPTKCYAELTCSGQYHILYLYFNKKSWEATLIETDSDFKDMTRNSIHLKIEYYDLDQCDGAQIHALNAAKKILLPQ